jgi:hypothetical protein
MKTDERPIITICASSSFYRQAVDLQEELGKLGFSVIVPVMADEMKKTNNFERTFFQPWLTDPTQYSVKADLMRGHFDKVAKADAILVINGEKHGVPNYIGGNVLMEMALAFHLGKPIFILNEVPEESAFKEEIHGMLPITLQGNVADLPKAYQKIGSTASA